MGMPAGRTELDVTLSVDYTEMLVLWELDSPGLGPAVEITTGKPCMQLLTCIASDRRLPFTVLLHGSQRRKDLTRQALWVVLQSCSRCWCGSRLPP